MNYPTVNRAQEAIGGRQLEEASVDQGEARGGPCMSVLVAYRNQLIAELHVVEDLIQQLMDERIATESAATMTGPSRR